VILPIGPVDNLGLGRRNLAVEQVTNHISSAFFQASKNISHLKNVVAEMIEGSNSLKSMGSKVYIPLDRVYTPAIFNPEKLPEH
jgi:hypothetical protein